MIPLYLAKTHEKLDVVKVAPPFLDKVRLDDKIEILHKNGTSFVVKINNSIKFAIGFKVAKNIFVKEV